MRQEQEEAPRERRGHPGGRRGRGRPGGGGTGRLPRARRSGGTRAGGGERRLCPCPRGLPGRRLSGSLLLRVLLPRRGAAGRPRRALLLLHSHSRLTRSHTHAHTHSLTLSLIHSNRKAAPHNSRYLLRERREGGDARNTATAVAKTSRRLRLPPGLPAARSALPVRPRWGPHLEDRVEEAGWPLPKAAAG